jgi:hypothetical protein
MYDETNVPGPEFQVRPVVRYTVTAYYHPYQSKDGSHGMTGSHKVMAECDNERHADEIAKSLETAFKAESEMKAAKLPER